MNDYEKEFLAKKILKEAIENVECLGFKIYHAEYSNIIESKNVCLISDERYNRGDY